MIRSLTRVADCEDSFSSAQMRGPALRLVCEHVLSVNNGLSQYGVTTDQNGLITGITDLHNSETRTNDARGRVLTRSFTSGHVLTYTWDDFDRLTAISDNTGPSISMVFDIMGKMLSRSVTPLGGGTSQTTFYTYDDRDRLTQVTNPKGEITKVGYNIISVGCHVRDLPTSIADTGGRVTTMQYDNRQRLTRVTDANGHVTRAEYNARGEKIAVTDPNGNRATFSYDGNSRLVQQTRPVAISGTGGAPLSATQITNYSYDTAGRLTSSDKYALGIANATHSTLALAYDPLDRVIQKTLMTGSNVDDSSTFSYSRQIDNVARISANNSVASLSFINETAPPFLMSSYSITAGSAGGALNLTQGTFNIGRDVTGNIAAVSGPNGQLYSAGYDPAGRLTGIQSGFNAANYSATIGYDGFGRKNSVTHSTGLAGTYSYDLLSRITAISWNGFDGETAQAMSENLAYDPAGNITSITRELGGFDFSYDSIDQLVSTGFAPSQGVNLGALVSRQWSWDPAGNRAGDNINGSSVFFANSILSDALHSYQSDSMGLGNVVQKNTPAAQVIDLFSYRADSRVTSYMNVTDVNGNGAYDPGADTMNRSGQFYYDALGRRAANVISKGGTSFTQSFSYLGDRGRFLTTTAGDGSTRLYLDAKGLNEHLAEIGPSGVKAFVSDHLLSVLNGPVAGGSMAFGAFGESLGSDLVLNASSDPASPGYAGYRFSSLMRIYELDHRLYDQESGRHLSSDPLSNGGSYGYVGGSPVKYVDPLGLSRGVVTPDRRHMDVYPGNTPDTQGPPQRVDIGNNTTNPNGDPNTVGSHGPAPAGTFPVQPPVRIPSDSDEATSYGTVFFPIGSVDSNGNPSDIARQRGIGLHGGRNGPGSRTEGCLRGNNSDLENLFNQNQSDPLTTITIPPLPPVELIETFETTLP